LNFPLASTPSRKSKQALREHIRTATRPLSHHQIRGFIIRFIAVESGYSYKHLPLEDVSRRNSCSLSAPCAPERIFIAEHTVLALWSKPLPLRDQRYGLALVDSIK
jgi:hypothetical protein